ncbi:MAG: HEPN domain-containing protein [Deltaproteobacteria bacterium]|nr:HEPN domain-containing protein [Deltaproteobacteria bacterium]
MRDNVKLWLCYAEDNFSAAQVLLESNLCNPCLQNVQQAVEKWLKALLMERSVELKKTHNIAELKNLCTKHGCDIELSDDDIEFLDAIYLPSKYPLGSALPNFDPDKSVCERALRIAEQVSKTVQTYCGVA